MANESYKPSVTQPKPQDLVQDQNNRAFRYDIDRVATREVHFAAAPTITDDERAGYDVGTTWVDTATGDIYVLVDNTSGAAVWTPLGTGSTGPQGPVGPPVFLVGEPGIDGEPGPPGHDGATGSTGAQGPTGPPIFLLGESGEDGQPGTPGRDGATGATGSTGAQGPVGPPVFLLGEPGEDGQPGAPGPAGATGTAGATGSQGQVGPAIYLVAEGEQGEVGSPGPQGATGPTGATGNTGAQGPQGPAIFLMGEPGEDGQPGFTPTPPPGGGVSDHGALTGLVPDDDHTQYALLAGRAGGQILSGGTAAGDDLTLLSSSHGTPTGDIIVGDYTGTFKIRGKNDAVLQVTSNGTNTTGIELGGDISGNATTYIDLHSSSASDYDLRLIRNGGANGSSQFYHNGTGQFDILAGSVINLETTAAVHIARGTTAQRPSGSNGRIRHNTDINSPEFYTEAWTQFVGVLDRQVTQLNIASSSSLTTFYTFSVPANVMDTQKMLRLRLFGDYLANSGSSTLRVQVVFGGTTMYDETSTGMTANANRKPFDFEFLLANQNSASVQVLGGTIGCGISGGATTGLGGMNTVITNATGFSTPVFGTAAVNTGSAQTLTVSTQHSVNNANVSIRRQFAILEVL